MAMPASPNRKPRASAVLISEDSDVKRMPSEIAVSIASGGSLEVGTFHRERQTTISGARWPRVYRQNAVKGPKDARMMPPRAGPTLRTVLNPTEVSVTAAARSFRSTISPTDACQAGSLKAMPQPARKLKNRMIQGLIMPKATRIVSAAAVTAIKDRAASITLRRLKLSTMAPAKIDRMKAGRFVAA